MTPLNNEKGKGGWIILLAILLLFGMPVGFIMYKGFTDVQKRAQQLAAQPGTSDSTKQVEDALTPEEKKQWEGEIKAFMVPFALFAAIVWGMSAIWVYRDAQDRGKTGFLVMMLVLLCAWPFSLLFWVMVRPPPKLA